MSFFRVLKTLFVTSMFIAAPWVSAKVTYNGTNGVYAQIFNGNSVKACTDCHATGESYQVYAKFDIYSNGTDGAYEKGSLANTYISAELMPYNADDLSGKTPLTSNE